MALQKLRAILAEINRPSAQRDSWFGWATGQMAHSMIGAVLAGSLLFILPPFWSYAVAVIGYAVTKEVPDFLKDRTWPNARDCTQDALFVAAGAALAIAISGAHDDLFFVALGAAVIGLWLGVSTRLKGGSDDGK